MTTVASASSSRSRASALRWTLRAAVVVLVVAVAALLLRGVKTTARPRVDTNGARPSRLAGFDQIGFQDRTAGGIISRHCGVLARTTAQHNRGLMNRTDLGGYDGMLFQFLDPTTTQFYMKDTLISLSIAWFDAGGHFLSSADMTPCGSASICPLYSASAPYTLALEVPKGQLGHLGIGAGSTIAVGGSC